MEDTEHIRDKNAILHLYNKVLPALATRIHQNLTEITPLFHDFGLEIIVDNWTKPTDESDNTQVSIENGNIQNMGLRLRLEGFQRAGAPPFDINKDLLFKLGLRSYEVCPEKNTVWMEKPYQQTWTENEKAEIAENWGESVIDEITQRLEGLT